MSSRIRRNILIFTIWYIRIRFSEITTRLRRIFRWGKIDRRKQLLLPSAPDLPYNKALPELYDSAKSPEKPSVTRVSCPNGVKKSLPALYPKLVGMVAEAVGFEPTCPLGQPHFECGSLRPLRYASMCLCGEQDDPAADRPVPLEVPPGFEPGNEGFADLCLTTWLWHQIKMER